MRSVSSQKGLVRFLSFVALASTLAVAGCRRNQGAGQGDEDSTSGGSTPRPTAQEPGPPPPDWPRVLVIGPGSGPALYLGHEENAPAVGYLNPGVRVRLESSPTNGRVEVLVGGGLSTKGWVPLARVGAYAQSRGRVEGTRAYVGPGDFLGILGAAEVAGQMRVEVRPWLGGGNFIGPFVGSFPLDQLADQPPSGEVEGVSPGECFTLPAGQTMTVNESAQGEPITNLPALDPPLAVTVLRQGNGLFGVRAGYGPYLTGYIRGDLTACAGEAPTPEPMTPPSDGERPSWMGQERGALHRVASGTRIRFHGRTIGRLRAEGWARELGRQDGGLVDVFIAVDDSTAVRGLVRESALTLVEGAAEPVAEPQEELPDELQ